MAKYQWRFYNFGDYNMMKDVTLQVSGIIDIHDHNHYTVNVNQLTEGTAVTCPFDSSMKVGRNEKGEVCIVKKSLFRPFKKL